MAAPASELGWVVHFAPVVRFTPLSPTFAYFACEVHIYKTTKSAYTHKVSLFSVDHLFPHGLKIVALVGFL